MKYTLYIPTLVLALSMPLVSVGIDTTTSGRIIDRFKEQQKEILFERLPLSETNVNAILQEEYALSWLEWLRSRIWLMQTAYTIKKEEVTNRRQTLEEALEILDATITQSENQLAISSLRIYQKDMRWQELSQELVDISKKIYAYRQVILSYLHHIYREGDVVFDDQGNIDIIRGLILSSGNTDELLSDMTYKSLVTILGQKFVDEYRQLKKNYYVLRIKIEEEKEELVLLKKDLERQKDLLEQQRIERVRLIDITRWEEQLYAEYIAAQEQALSTVEIAYSAVQDRYEQWITKAREESGCLIQEEVEEISKKCKNIELYFENEKKLRSYSYATGSDNIFLWPVDGGRISAYFRDAEYYHYLRSHHDAIDIAIAQGSEVVASAPGYIHYILPPMPGGYSFLAIKHPDNYMTVYGHLSEVVVFEWQFVQAGELIAKSGGAVGTPGAWPMTSGPHLHFELWKDKNPVDPLRYINIAHIDYTAMPTRYQDKFIADFLEIHGPDAKTTQYERKFLLRWESETERQKFLLNTYATPDFRSWDMWIDAALDARVDPSFMMCIWLAETTLGNRLKTPYNIGNIGNTDSGSTYSFTSPSQWLYWMSVTFNNKYLGNYTKISELSRWGNTTGPIYASSNANWHNNIVRCLSALKWRFVEDDFEFRVKE